MAKTVILNMLGNVRNALNNPVVTSGEAQTKQSVINPILRTLFGYDIADPSQVIVEHVDGSTDRTQRLDYLLKNGEHAVVVEAKAADRPLTDKHAKQLYRYYRTVLGFDLAAGVLTNGDHWKFYHEDTTNGGLRLYCEFRISDPGFLTPVTEMHIKALSHDQLPQKQVTNLIGLQNDIVGLRDRHQGWLPTNFVDIVQELVERPTHRTGATPPASKATVTQPKTKAETKSSGRGSTGPGGQKRKQKPPTPLAGFTLFGQYYATERWATIWPTVVNKVWERHPSRDVFLQHTYICDVSDRFPTSLEENTIRVGSEHARLKTPKYFAARTVQRQVPRLLELFGYTPDKEFQIHSPDAGEVAQTRGTRTKKVRRQKGTAPRKVTPLSGFTLFGNYQPVNRWSDMWNLAAEQIWEHTRNREAFQQHKRVAPARTGFLAAYATPSKPIGDSGFVVSRHGSAQDLKNSVEELLKLCGHDPQQEFTIHS